MRYNYFITLTFAILFLFIATGTSVSQTNNPYPAKVAEYCPAPGQFVNEKYPSYENGDTYETMKIKALQCFRTPDNSGLVSLGAYGGFITLTFDHPILNSRGDYDFKVYGNFMATSAEPGIVMVSRDVNNNGLPDDTWYELKGSEYQKCLQHYQITYTRPNPLNDNISWTDNQGNSGTVLRNSFHNQASYYPLWISDATLTFTGTLFPDSLLGKANQWGYADNRENDNNCGLFKIDWAVDEDGNPVNLASVDFIRVYTAVNKCDAIMGEISTELAAPGIEDLHPDMAHNIAQNTLDPYKDYYLLDLETFTLPGNSFWDKTLSYDAALDPDNSGTNEFEFAQFPYIFHYATLYWGASWEGFTYCNIKDNTSIGYDNQFAAITGGGIEGIGKNYITTYYSSFSELNKQYFEFSDGKSYNIAGCYLTNNVVAYYSMLLGDTYTKKFGGEDGTDPDWFKVTFTGIDMDGKITGSVDFYLADFRFENSAEDYIVGEWRWVDLNSLGRVAKVLYSMSSSDSGDYGMNTPSYFCLDKIAVEKETTSTAYLSWIKINDKLLEEFEPERVFYFKGISENILPVVTAKAADEINNVSIHQAAGIPGIATITVTTPLEESKIYTLFFEKMSGIEDVETPSTTLLYPNPFNDYFIVETQHNNYNISVFTLDGKMIYQAHKTDNIINTSNWNKGLYLIKINDNKNQFIIKAIKNR